MQLEDVKYLSKHIFDFVDFNDQLKFSIGFIAFNPIFWNVVARTEYKSKFISKITGPRIGCYFLAATIFSLGIYRDHVYQQALLEQPTFAPMIKSQVVKAIALLTFGIGNILVVTSMYALGITGTYLGDYFGILMNDRVTGFPFNVNDNPMYNGSALCFLGVALWYGKPAGILVAAFVWIMYKIALKFEEPFTAQIYANRDKKDI